jgi:SPP1 gp7 family putative phage head morphogenesis protein
VGAADRYARGISKAFHAMHVDYAEQLRLAMEAGGGVQAMKELLDALKARWEAFFDATAPELAQRWAEQAAQSSLAITDSAIAVFAKGITLPAPKFSPEFTEKMSAAIEGNIGLIVSMRGVYQDEMQAVVMRAFTDPDGGAHKIFEEALRHYPKDAKFNVRKRAAFTAQFETAKITALVNKERCDDLGIEEFMWCHSAGSAEPRPDHVAMDGKIFRYDDPPVIDRRTGQRGLPGTIFRCRCFPKPVFPFTNREKGEGVAEGMLDKNVKTLQYDPQDGSFSRHERKIDKKIFNIREPKEPPLSMLGLMDDVLKGFKK